MALGIGTATSTSDAILDACDRIMARYGFRKMTMDDLAHEARVSKRTIYLHFKGKEDVGLSSIGRVVERVLEELRELARAGGLCEHRLSAMLRARVLGRLEQVQRYHESLDELFEAVRPEYLARRKAFFDREIALLAAVIREGVASGELRLQDPENTAEALVLATNAFLPYSLSVRELGAPSTLEPRLDDMIAVLMYGVAGRDGHPQETSR